MSVTVIHALELARKTLEGEGAWCHGAFARTVEGSPTSASGANAVSRCAVGAVLHAAHILQLDAAATVEVQDDCIEALIRVVPDWFSHKSVSIFNDAPRTKQDDILALFDNAIKRLKIEIGDES